MSFYESTDNVDYIDDLALLTNTPTQTESLLQQRQCLDLPLFILA